MPLHLDAAKITRRLSYHFENKRRDKEGRLNREAEAGGDNAFLDLTDTENRQFRYCT
jgi:hypothetical protein